MFKKSALVCISAAQLAACGGGSSGSDTPQSPPPVTTTIQVVDGYLENVSVCVDRNLDNKCHSDEFIEGRTNELGRIDIPTADLKYPLIANIFAGESNDSDQLAPVSNSYQMIAPAGVNTINPFTTVAQLSGKTIQELATDLGLASSVLTSNFVEKRSNQIDAAVAHMIARSITRDFTSSLGDMSVDGIHATMMAFKDKATDLSNQHTIEELNKMILRQLGDGSVVDDERMVTSLSDYLKDNGEFQVSFVAMDGSTKMATFDGTHALGSLTNSVEREYTTESNQLILSATDTTPEVTYKFIYISHHLSISYENSSKTMQAWTHKDLSPDTDIEIREDQLRSQTFTLLTSSSDENLETVSLNFAKEGNQVDVTFYDATPDITATWSIETIPNAPDVIHIQPPEGSTVPRIALAILEDAAQDWVAFNLSNGRPSVLFKDQGLAHRVFDYWRARNDRFISGHDTFHKAIQGSEFHYYPLTNSMDSMDTISAYQFLEDDKLCEFDSQNTLLCEYNYNVLFHDLRLSHKGTYDLNFRRSNQFFIGFGQNRNPGIWLRNPQNRMTTPEKSWFTNKTWYWVRDINSDANGPAKPTKVTLKFLEQNTVEIDAPGAEPFTTQWKFQPYVDDYRTFSSIYIPLPEEQRDIDSLRGEDFIQFGAIVSSDDAMVIETLSTNTLTRENLLLRTDALADYLVEYWTPQE